MKSWREEFDRYWLARESVVNKLDEWVRDELAKHRKQNAATIAPWSVKELVRNVDDFGRRDQWIWCVAAISVLQELVFCAEGGGMDSVGIAEDRDLKADIEALRAIRNAAFHAAAQVDGKRDKNGGPKKPPMVRAIEFLQKDDDPDIRTLAKRLPDEWSLFAEEPVAIYTLRKLGSAGRLFLTKKRLVKPSQLWGPRDT